MPPKIAVAPSTALKPLSSIVPSFITTYPFYIIVASFLFAMLVIYYAISDPNTLISMNFIYGITVTLPIFLGFVYYVYSAGAKNKKIDLTNIKNMELNSLLKYSGILVGIILCLIAYTKLKTMSTIVVGYIINVIMFFIIIIGLTIFYNVFMSYFMKLEGTTGFIIKLIFFIPCFISDLIEYLKNEYKITPNIVFILFCIELVLLLSYLYLPRIINMFSTKSGTQFVSNPIFLTKQTIVADASSIPHFTRMNVTLDTSGVAQAPSNSPFLNSSPEYYKNYGISMWIYINQQELSNSAYTTEHVLFNYGTPNINTINSKPAITYFNNTTESGFYIYFTPPDEFGEANRYKITDIPLQKWNQFVINYSNNMVDVFINGVLVYTFNNPTTNYPTYNFMDCIIIGDNKGIDGAICNMTYYTTPLTLTEIVNSYNMNQFHNPPLS
jgi:hypothetical protein